MGEKISIGPIVKITKSDSDWKKQLTPEQYQVLRHEGTEPPFRNAFHDNKTPGLYHCAGCDLPLFSSGHKFDSGTGWPSFWQALPGAVGNREDRRLFMVRTEEHCSNCGGHLGHVFDDGPQPTGNRHCINGVALRFQPA